MSIFYLIDAYQTVEKLEGQFAEMIWMLLGEAACSFISNLVNQSFFGRHDGWARRGIFLWVLGIHHLVHGPPYTTANLTHVTF